MNLHLLGKTAIVTGASKGIGAAVALTLAREGANVLAVARTHAELDPGPHAKGRIVPFQVDLTLPQACDAIVDAIKHVFGRVDILANNAGSTQPGDFFQIGDDAWQQGFELKFHGARRLIRACWPELKATHGAVVNTIGIMSRTAVIDYAIGGAVNSALLHLTKALSDLGIRDGVRVNAVNPGRIATDRLESSLERTVAKFGVTKEDANDLLLKQCGISRFGTTDEIAAAVCFLASDRAGFINGAILDVDGGQTRSL